MLIRNASGTRVEHYIKKIKKEIKIPPIVPPLIIQRQIEAEFAEWWVLYPHKVGKAAARRKFETVRKRGVKPEVLLAGVRRYIEAKPEDHPWCNPATWLNQDRWEDEPAGSAEPVLQFRSQADEQWRYRVWRFRGDSSQWDAQWGPQPGQPGCRAPADALQAYRFQPPELDATGVSDLWDEPQQRLAGAS